MSRTIRVDDKIRISGGYYYEPRYLQDPPVEFITGTIIQFIKGQNENPAAVVHLDNFIQGRNVKGDIAILEIRHEGYGWTEPASVHIELCDFIPEDKTWKDRRQGEWIEAAATVVVQD